MIETMSSTFLLVDSADVKDPGDLNSLIGADLDGIICIARAEVLAKISENEIIEELRICDVLHAGLLFEGGCSMLDIQMLTLNWEFLTPDPSRVAYTWKATSDFVCFDVRLAKKLKGFVHGLSVNGAIMEFCYRVMKAGGCVKHNPAFVDLVPGFIRCVTPKDTLYFVSTHLGRLYGYSLQAYYFLASFRFHRIPRGFMSPGDDDVSYAFKLIQQEKVSSIREYSAIIPTIDRYEYIGKSIDSLVNGSFPPNEVIIVDQTERARRRYDIYEPFRTSGIVKVIYLDSPGQSTARNIAIAAARNEWLLLFEDDTEAWPSMVADHISLIESSFADVSTGVSLAPWKDISYIPERLRKFQIADVLATGNAFLSKTVANSVGGLDPAFDRGSGADDDFGRRLYLTGKLIVFNHKAIQTHHKAPQGGMRVHGAWWRNKTTLLGAYPPATQLYSIWKFYHKRHHLFLVLSLILKARKRYKLMAYCGFIILLPYKFFRSVHQARRIASR